MPLSAHLVNAAALHLSTKPDPIRVRPTHAWTFDNALALLLDPPNESLIANALDDFLLLNAKIVSSPLPLGTYSASQTSPSTTDFVLRDILYSLHGNNASDATVLARSLNVNLLECLRILSQTCQRIPERKISTANDLESKLTDDRHRSLESNRLRLYASRILRERRTILKIAAKLVAVKTDLSFSHAVRNLGKQLFMSKLYLIGILDAIAQTSQEILNPPMNELDLDLLLGVERALLLLDLLRVFIELSLLNPVIDSEITQKWFKVMHDVDFIVKLGPRISSSESITLLHALLTIVSLLLLDLENAYESSAKSYFVDAKAFNAIDSCVPTHNLTIAYAWYILLMRKYCFIQDNLSSPFLSDMPLTRIQHSLAALTDLLASSDPFEAMANLAEILSYDLLYSEVLLTAVLAAMPLISLLPDNSRHIARIVKNAPQAMVECFFGDESTVRAIVVARTKFPLEIGPYLAVASINGAFAAREFAELRSCVQVVDEKLVAQMYLIDDEDTLLMVLNGQVDIYPPFEAAKRLALLVGPGTKAKILPTTVPNHVLVTFLYKYDGWAFLGRILLNISRYFDASDTSKIEAAIQIISVLTAAAQDCETADVLAILDLMSTYADDFDALQVLFRLMEQGLYSRQIELGEQILKLLTALVPSSSKRIWSYLSDSSLLSNPKKQGLAAVLFGTIEMTRGDYSFTVALTKLVDALIMHPLTFTAICLDAVKLTVLSKLTAHICQVHDAFVHCFFKETQQKFVLGTLITNALMHILLVVYGAPNNAPAPNRTTGFLSASAQLIVESFLVPGTDSPRLSLALLSLIDIIADDFTLYEAHDLLGDAGTVYLKSSLDFAKILLQTRSQVQHKPLALELTLYTKLPQLIRAYSQHNHIRRSILDLLTALNSGKWDQESEPSLLSHVGPEHANLLLHSLSADMENTFDHYSVKLSLYNFVCLVFERQQGGLSVLFISGKAMFGGEIDKDTTSKSLLSVMKKNVRDISNFPFEVGVHLLDAISLAYNSWNMVHDLSEDLEFLDELIMRVKLVNTDEPKLVDEYLNRCFELRLCAKAAEILALFQFTSRNTTILDKISSLMEGSELHDSLLGRFTIKEYQHNLQQQLAQTFSNTYKELELHQFARAVSQRNAYSLSALYNWPLLELLLGEKESWPDMRDKIVKENINGQYVSAQVAVSKSFGALVTAFCRRSTKPLSPRYLDGALALLKLAAVEWTPDERMEAVTKERIELAFYIIYTMYRSLKPPSHSVLLQIAETCCSLASNTGMNLDTSNGAKSLRPLARILFCCLDTVKDNAKILVQSQEVLHAVFRSFVVSSTLSLLLLIQNDVYLLRTDKTQKATLRQKIEDLHLIHLILKALVSMKLPQSFRQDMARLLKGQGIAKLLLTLVGVSHAIEIDDEHILALVSLMMIQEYVLVDFIAEIFVEEGLFMALAESPITSPIKKGGLSCSEGNSYYKIWNNGVLRLICTCLAKLGPQVLPEACVALQIFRRQIESCVSSWMRELSSLAILTSLIQETRQLLVLYDLLVALSDGSLELSAEMDVDMAVIPGWESRAKRSDFCDSLHNLLKHPKFLSSRVVPSNGEERHIIESGGEASSKFFKCLMDEISELIEAFEPED